MKRVTEPMPNQKSISRLANVVARAIRRALDKSQFEFREITRRARQRFAERDWRGMNRDSTERLGVYEAAVDDVVVRIRELLTERVRSRLVWASIKAVYSGLIDQRDDWEIAETFFNSVTRRIFDTVGVEDEIEFVHSDYPNPPSSRRRRSYRSFDAATSLDQAIRVVLASSGLPLSGDALQQQATAAASFVAQRLRRMNPSPKTDRIEVIESVFYRGEYAYLIGRFADTKPAIPLVLCLRHGDRGVYVDAVLLEESDVSMLFSFSRSYFHVDTGRPFDVVKFIKSIIPRKPRSDIYSSIGYKKHGKTELYRHALRHLASSTDKYELARGQRGMVMVVFTMPSYPVVFKIIKDTFDYPKQTTRQAVIDCYRLVFKHDRAGRLVDAQEYQYLTLDRHRFDDAASGRVAGSRRSHHQH
ncbi:MAG: isocitrate dehydrogenase kinase/phosphatase AceK regulatory subunit [Pirellulales bacterium]